MGLFASFKKFTRDTRGSVIVAFAVAVPVIMLAGAASFELVQLTRAKSGLQAATDNAAIAAANELYLSNVSANRVQAIAASFIKASPQGGPNAQVKSEVIDNKTAVRVVAHLAKSDSIFASMGGFDAGTTVTATARVVGGGRICVIGLSETRNSTIQLDKGSAIEAPTCSVYSNSTKPNGIKVKNGSSMEAEFICSAGGKDGTKGAFEPDPVLDCPVTPDPLAARPEPDVGSCDHTNHVIGTAIKANARSMETEEEEDDDRGAKKTAERLFPGVYCGGLTINGNYQVTFEPGEYIIKDGPLVVDGGATMQGEYVGFFLTGNNAAIDFQPASVIDIGAPKTGRMAGILLWSDANNSGAINRIHSNNARNLLGTIYLPTSDLEIVTNKYIADKSAYTVLVVEALTLDAGPELKLNTDYNATDVPVPNGVGPVGGGVRLTN